MPEVQAHAERLTDALAGKTLTKFELLNFAALKTFNPPADGAVGHKLTGVGRRAKYLLLQFDNGHTHVVHLMQGGRLRPDPKRSKKPRLGLARWVFSDGDGDSANEEAWLLTEAGTERKAGVWAVDGDPLPQDPLLGLGPEADQLTRDELAELLSAHSRRLHGLLREQKTITGLGRMLANEILYEARLSPFANASKLDDEQLDRLHAALQSVVARGTDHERTLHDIGKSADRPSKVHNRSGEPCLDCDDTIRTVEYRRYTVYYCP
ncbi:MAG: DNA-formamidopyrimidine glycosylase family protein, partial [Acidimicrobiales bacterium]